MNIFLKKIDENNWRECVNLKIKDEQKQYLPHPNVVSIAELLNKIRNENDFNEIWLSFHPKSIVAARLYSSFGFKQRINGLETEDEVFYVLKYRRTRGK
ncbi:hypothetical protein [Clostridium sp.]|uniref:hypothetical protein n=1 Tax=Clostridium sp. TaxID=1506 RepID=UPI003D6D1023